MVVVVVRCVGGRGRGGPCGRGGEGGRCDLTCGPLLDEIMKQLLVSLLDLSRGTCSLAGVDVSPDTRGYLGWAATASGSSPRIVTLHLDGSIGIKLRHDRFHRRFRHNRLLRLLLLLLLLLLLRLLLRLRLLRLRWL